MTDHIKLAPAPLRVVIITAGMRPELLREEYGEPGWEFWGMNAMRPKWAQDLPWARWFNLHRFDHLVRDWQRGLEDEIAWAKANPKVPFYVLDDWEEWPIPRVVRFPAAGMALEMPRAHYHAGSFDWLVAFAVYLGAVEIAIHGLSLALDSPRDEPISARACFEYWAGYAEGRGCKVWTAEDCDVFYQYHLVRSRTLYGYDDVRLVEDRTREIAQMPSGPVEVRR